MCGATAGNKDREEKMMSLYMKYTSLLTSRGTLGNRRAQFPLAISSLNIRMPPEREKKNKIVQWTDCALAWANLWNPACSLLAMQLHTTCWMLSRECSRQVAGELMKCQDGGREIACITYPQGALVVFPRISHTNREHSRLAVSHWRRKLRCLQLTINFFPESCGDCNQSSAHCWRRSHGLQRLQAWRDLIA